jgi:hypothetical protein
VAKKITLETLAAQIAEGFAKQGKEIKDLTESVSFVVKQMATKDDTADRKFHSGRHRRSPVLDLPATSTQ